MENFITGYPANEEAQRQASHKVLGDERADYFFDHFLGHVFTVGNARFIRLLDRNLLRFPVNDRHFDDGMEPFEIDESGGQAPRPRD